MMYLQIICLRQYRIQGCPKMRGKIEKIKGRKKMNLKNHRQKNWNLLKQAEKEKEAKVKNTSAPEHYVTKLTEPIQDTNRNLIVDNWFSSISLFDKMFDLKIYITSTFRKNKKEILPSFLANKKELHFLDLIVIKCYFLLPLKDLFIIKIWTSIEKNFGLLYILILSKRLLILLINFFQYITIARKINRWFVLALYGILVPSWRNTMVLHFLNLWPIEKLKIGQTFLFNLGFI